MRKRTKSKTRSTVKRRRRRSSARRTTVKRKRLAKNRRTGTTVRRRKRRLSKNRKPAVKRTVRRRRRSAARKTTTKRKTRRSAAKRPIKRKRRRAKAKLTPNRRKRSRRLRRNSKRRTKRTTKRSSARKRTRKVTRRRASSKRTRRASGRRLKRNSSRRRSHRRNGKRRMRRNRGFFGGLFRKNPEGLLLAGLLTFSAFAGSKFVGNLIAKGISKLASGSAPAVAPAAGLGSLDAMASPLGSVISGLVGIPLTMKLVTDESKRTPLLLGQISSVLHSLAVAALGAISPSAKAVLSGDDTAVRLAAMYGMGGGTSIMPHYAPVNSMGEYLTAQNGVGEYFSANGMGEYFESGVEGLGNYVGNVDMEQAAAGYGATETRNTNHIDPSSDLDRELTIAEAAAGVGSAVYQAAAGVRGYGALPPYVAQAGMGEYFGSGVNGLGNVGIAPSANTWIPGMSDPQLWAGTRAVNETQEATAQVPAGVLQSGGSQGVFG